MTELSKTICSQKQLIFDEIDQFENYLLEGNSVWNNLWNGELFNTVSSLLCRLDWILSLAKPASKNAFTIYDYFFIKTVDYRVGEILMILNEANGCTDIFGFNDDDQDEGFYTSILNKIDETKRINADTNTKNTKYRFIGRVNEISSINGLSMLFKEFDQLKQDINDKCVIILRNEIELYSSNFSEIFYSICKSNDEIIESEARLYSLKNFYHEEVLIREIISLNFWKPFNKDDIQQRKELRNLAIRFLLSEDDKKNGKSNKNQENRLLRIFLEGEQYAKFLCELLPDEGLFDMHNIPVEVQDNLFACNVELFIKITHRYNVIQCIIYPELRVKYINWINGTINDQDSGNEDKSEPNIKDDLQSENKAESSSTPPVLENDIIEYVSVLALYFNGSEKQHERLWRKIIKEGKKIKYTTGRGKNISLFEMNVNKGHSFNKRTIHSVIGLMAANNKYTLDIPSLAKLLGDDPKKRTIAHNMQNTLENLGFEPSVTQNLTTLLK